MNKKIIIPIISTILIIVVIIMTYLVSTKTAPLQTVTSEIDLTSLEGQMEHINISDNDVSFMTFRNTALAKIDNGETTAKDISEQVINGEISNLYWYPDKQKVLLEIVNDPAALEGYSNYKDPETTMVYATYNLGDNLPIFLGSAPGFTWLTGSQILSLGTNYVYQHTGDQWKKTGTKLSSNPPILSTAGGSFADYINGKVTIYDEKLKTIRVLEQKFAESSRIRIFDNGGLIYADSSSIRLFPANHAPSKINITPSDQFAAGANCFIYSQYKKDYIYLAKDSTTYQINYGVNNIDYYKLFGLSDSGVVYFSGDSYVGKLLRLGGGKP